MHTGIKLFPFWVNLHQQAINCWRALALKWNSPRRARLVWSTRAAPVYMKIYLILLMVPTLLAQRGLAQDESAAIPTLRDVARCKMYRGFLLRFSNVI